MPHFQNKRVSEGLCKNSAFTGPNKDGNMGNAEVTVPTVTEGRQEEVAAGPQKGPPEGLNLSSPAPVPLGQYGMAKNKAL